MNKMGDSHLRSLLNADQNPPMRPGINNATSTFQTVSNSNVNSSLNATYNSNGNNNINDNQNNIENSNYNSNGFINSNINNTNSNNRNINNEVVRRQPVQHFDDASLRETLEEINAMNSVVPTDAERESFMKRLLLKLPAIATSSSDSEGESNELSHGEETSGNRDRNRESNRSPPPNCAICLSRCKNKCFTDSCMHQFCFKCLCEWSKVKPECPLCKQVFKSIIHNVKSIDQFDEYHVTGPLANNPRSFNLDNYNVLNYGDRYLIVPQRVSRTDRSVVGAGNIASGIEDDVLNIRDGAIGQVTSGSSTAPAVHSLQFSRFPQGFPHNVVEHFYRRASVGFNTASIDQMWRSYIYDLKLYAQPVCDATGRFRECSARFYRDNPAQIHRLMPWVRREINCLITSTSNLRDDVCQTIADSLPLMNLQSPSFRRRMLPFFGAKTLHFIHELNNFARSPFDMHGYDRAVRYSPRIRLDDFAIENSLSESSDNNDDVIVTEEVFPQTSNTPFLTTVASAVLSSSTLSLSSSSLQSSLTSSGLSLSSSSASLSSISSPISITSSPSSMSLIRSECTTRTTATVAATSSRSDIHIVTSNVNRNTQENRNRSNNQSQINTNNENIHNIEIIDLLDDGNSDQGNMGNMSNISTNSSNIVIDDDNSTLASATISYQLNNQYSEQFCSNNIQQQQLSLRSNISYNENIVLSSESSNECEFVLERKPPHLRTPELVSLNSASDSDVVFIDEVKIVNNNNNCGDAVANNNQNNAEIMIENCNQSQVQQNSYITNVRAQRTRFYNTKNNDDDGPSTSKRLSIRRKQQHRDSTDLSVDYDNNKKLFTTRRKSQKLFRKNYSLCRRRRQLQEKIPRRPLHQVSRAASTQTSTPTSSPSLTLSSTACRTSSPASLALRCHGVGYFSKVANGISVDRRIVNFRQQTQSTSDSSSDTEATYSDNDYEENEQDTDDDIHNETTIDSLRRSVCNCIDNEKCMKSRRGKYLISNCKNDNTESKWISDHYQRSNNYNLSKISKMSTLKTYKNLGKKKLTKINNKFYYKKVNKDRSNNEVDPRNRHKKIGTEKANNDRHPKKKEHRLKTRRQRSVAQGKKNLNRQCSLDESSEINVENITDDEDDNKVDKSKLQNEYSGNKKRISKATLHNASKNKKHVKTEAAGFPDINVETRKRTRHPRYRTQQQKCTNSGHNIGFNLQQSSTSSSESANVRKRFNGGGSTNVNVSKYFHQDETVGNVSYEKSNLNDNSVINNNSDKTSTTDDKNVGCNYKLNVKKEIFTTRDGGQMSYNYENNADHYISQLNRISTDDETDNLNLSTLKTLLKAEKGISLKCEKRTISTVNSNQINYTNNNGANNCSNNNYGGINTNHSNKNSQNNMNIMALPSTSSISHYNSGQLEEDNIQVYKDNDANEKAQNVDEEHNNSTQHQNNYNGNCEDSDMNVWHEIIEFEYNDIDNNDSDGGEDKDHNVNLPINDVKHDNDDDNSYDYDQQNDMQSIRNLGISTEDNSNSNDSFLNADNEILINLCDQNDVNEGQLNVLDNEGMAMNECGINSRYSNSSISSSNRSNTSGFTESNDDMSGRSCRVHSISESSNSNATNIGESHTVTSLNSSFRSLSSELIAFNRGAFESDNTNNSS